MDEVRRSSTVVEYANGRHVACELREKRRDAVLYEISSSTVAF